MNKAKNKTIVARLLSVSLVAGCVFPDALGGAVEFRRTVSEAASPSARRRALGRTWIFAERQPYLAHQNYLWHYIDRPLFTDVSVRRSAAGANKAGFFRDIDVLKWSGFDGFGLIAHLPVTGGQFKWITENPVEGYMQMPVLHGFGAKPDRAGRVYANMKRMILNAAECPSAPRIGGKLVVWGWGNVADRQCGWIRLLKSDPEIPPFIYLCETPFLPLYGAYGKLKPGEKLPEEMCCAYQRELVDRLGYCDGFKLRVHEYFRFHDGEYGNRALPHGLCEEYLYPLTLEVMNRPEYADKYLGVYVEQAYINHLNGPVTGQYGTECLRTFMDGALKMNVDFIMAFEWNEANENTSFQPMVSSSDAVARIMGFYRSRLDGTKPTPRKGDDVSVPNLVLSTRQKMRIGETYRAEMLYIPDGTDPEPFEARTVICSADGRELCALPWERLPVDNLTAFSYEIPSEKFAAETAVVPRIETRSGGKTRIWTGFDCTRLEPTWCTHYLYSRQPLRMLAEPEECGFSVKKSDGGGYDVKASFRGRESLASFELMDGCEEVRAFDREGEFDRSKYDVFRLSLNSMKNLGRTKGTFDIPGVSGWKLRPAEVPWYRIDVERDVALERPRRAEFTVACHHYLLLAVPKAAMGVAKLVLDFDKLPGVPAIDLAEVKRLGFTACSLANNVRLEFERLDGLADYPVHIDSPTAEITGLVDSPNRYPVYQLRVVTKSGKTWRSAPSVPERPAGSVRRIESYSEYERKTVPITVASSRIPDISYRFGDSSHGDWLTASGGDRRWNAMLGGGWKACGPMRSHARKFTSEFTNAVPVRVFEDGVPALRFDGRGQYLSLPQEFIPVASGYALAFEIKPDDAENRVLVRMTHSVDTETTLRLVTEDATVKLSYFGRNLVPRHFRHGAKLKAGEWNRVEVEKRADTIVCTVNGEKKVFPYNRRGLVFQTAAFGANVAPGAELPKDIKPFKGYLRALGVRHGADAGF